MSRAAEAAARPAGDYAIDRLRMIEPMDLLDRCYAAFNARDIEGALALMHADVDWPNGMEGGRVHGHAGVRDYWTRQFTMILSTVTPEAREELPDGRISLKVHAVVRDVDGTVLSDGYVTHVYTLRDGLVERMDIVTPA